MIRRFRLFFDRLGLQYKFILLTTWAIIVIVTTIGYLAVERERTILYSEVEKQGRLLGETLAIPIVNDLIYERLGLVEEGGLLDNYIMEIFNRREADLLYIAILDEGGKVISHNDITEYGKTYSDPITLRALASEKTEVQPIAGLEHGALDFGVPLAIGKKRWGTLKFGVSMDKAEQEIIATIKKITAMTIAFLLIGFTTILLLSRRFISPITQLAATMDKARGDFLDLRVDIQGHDELAILGERFNSMLERIKQANEELKKTHDKLVQSEKLASIGILAAGVAHEINNPLGGIFNCIRMLRENDDNPQLREKYLSLMNEGIEKIENTVNKLLWMSRKGSHDPVFVNVRNATQGVYSFLEYQIKRNNIQFENRVPEDLHLFFDVHDFQQMLMNLFINAVHAMDGGGLIEVTGSGQNGSVVIEVKDSGCGITEEHIGKIFDPFFTTKPTGEGTGLGLWLTYEIVRNYNGEISVESRQGEGTKFVMRFPVSDGPPQSRPVVI